MPLMTYEYTAHSQVADKDGGEADNKDEAIVPTDMNLICDDDLREIFSALSPEVKFTMVSDCCHSGSMLDHPEQQISGNKDPNAPAGVSGMDPAALMGMFFKGIPVRIILPPLPFWSPRKPPHSRCVKPTGRRMQR